MNAFSLVRAADLADVIARAFRGERERILTVLPAAEVLHTGATSVPEALTRGDLDIHVRVSPATFFAARDILAEAYRPVYQAIWTDELATFRVADGVPKTGIALTAIGGEHDRRFIVGWQQLRADPRLVAELNEFRASNST